MKLPDQTYQKFKDTHLMTQLVNEHKLQLDNSHFSSLSLCSAKGIYDAALRRVPARSASALAFGNAIHIALEALLYGEDIATQTRLALEFADEADSYDVKHPRDRIIEAIASYNVHYDTEAEQFNPISLNNRPAIEVPFSLPIGTIKVYLPDHSDPVDVEVSWNGKIDLVTRRTDHSLWVVDHKTTSMMGERFVDDKLRGNQMLGYVWAASQLVEEPISGVLINAICKRKKGFEFRLFSLPYATWKIQEWQVEILVTVKAAAENLLYTYATQHTVPTRDNCVTKYGRCCYFDVCEAHPRMRHELLFSDEFTTSTWSPLK